LVTDAGLLAIGIAPATAKTTSTTQGGDQVAKPPTPRAGTKQAQLIATLQQSDGATIGEIVAATLWMPHTVRGAISGVLKKKFGFFVTTGRIEGRGKVYRIDASDT
jgi:Protein of unknown function (DUF3489)